MKKVLIILLVLVSELFAQFGVGGGTALSRMIKVYPDSGFIGIGTQSMPLAKVGLHFTSTERGYSNPIEESANVSFHVKMDVRDNNPQYRVLYNQFLETDINGTGEFLYGNIVGQFIKIRHVTGDLSNTSIYAGESTIYGDDSTGGVWGRYETARQRGGHSGNVWGGEYQGEVYAMTKAATATNIGGINASPQVCGYYYAGSATNMFAVKAAPLMYTRSGKTASATNVYGFYAANPFKYGSGTNTITNNYGVYIENQTAGVNNYAFYSNGGNSYHKGNMGIGAEPSSEWELNVGGDVYVLGTLSADSIKDRCQWFVGDALSAINRISGVGTIKNDWQELNHSTLPKGVKSAVAIPKYKNKKSGKIMDEGFVPSAPAIIDSVLVLDSADEAVDGVLVANGARAKRAKDKAAKKSEKYEYVYAESDYEPITVQGDGRDLGAMVSLLTKGIQELIIENASLRARIERLEKKN